MKFLSKINKVLLWLLPLAFLIYFYFQPLLAIFRIAFQSANLDKIISSWDLISGPIYFTFWQATLSTIITIVVGFPAAYMMAKFRFFGKSILQLLITLPFIMPTVVVAAGFNALLGPKGWINILLQNMFSLENPPVRVINTLAAILLAHIFYNSTVFIRVVGGAWGQLNPKLEFAARSLGASPFNVLKQVTLPLLKPAILSAVILVFLFNFTSFAVILLLGGPKFSTIEVEIYVQALNLFNLPLAGFLSAIQLVFTLVITIFYTRLTRKKNIQLTPLDPEEVITPIRSWKERIFIGGVTTYLIGLFVLPLFSLLLKSIVVVDSARTEPGSFSNFHLSLIYYQELFINRRESLFYVPPIAAIMNSLYFGLITVGIALFLGFLAAKLVSSKNILGMMLDPILMLPLGTSAVTLGLGFILVFNHPPIDVRSFPLLIPIAHALVAMPFVVRVLQPVVASFPRELIYSSQVLGASPLRTFWHVEFPILFRAIMSAALFAFTISLGEFGATTFISRPEQPTIPIAIYRYLSQPGAMNYGQAMAMSTILMLICASTILIIEKLNLPGIKEF